MVEIAQKRIDVIRQRVGIDGGAQRGFLATPASVDEALRRLIEVEGSFKSFHENGDKAQEKKSKKINPNNREKLMESLVEKKAYKDGRLVHKTESEVRSHTSYLVFAILPQEWSEEEEKNVRAEWPIKIRRDDDKTGEDRVIGMNKNKAKKAERHAKKEKPMPENRTSDDDSENKMVLKQEASVEDQTEL